MRGCGGLWGAVGGELIVLTTWARCVSELELGSSSYHHQTASHGGLSLPRQRPGPFACQVISGSLTDSRINQRENKASVIQIEKQKESRAWMLL